MSGRRGQRKKRSSTETSLLRPKGAETPHPERVASPSHPPTQRLTHGEKALFRARESLTENSSPGFPSSGVRALEIPNPPELVKPLQGPHSSRGS